jgi:3-dehydroquinate dehydratase-1
MLRIGGVELGSIPRLAAVFSDTELEVAASMAQRHADVLELRVDRFTRHDASHVVDVCRSARRCRLPLIVTVRAAAEGGESDLDDDARLALLRATIPEVDAIDVELESPICTPAIGAAHGAGKLVIASFHDFDATPADDQLARRIEAGVERGADVVKLATMARQAGDLDRMLGLLRAQRSRNLILIAMGAHGVASRVFFPLLGSLLTYGCAAGAVAPGQLPLAELDRELCRYSPELARERAAR